MENRSIVIFWLALASFLVFNRAFAYSIETHEYLTEETVNFYNQNYKDKQISADLEKYIIEGDKAEDANPRYFNHFYDSINGRGLRLIEKSKSWPNSYEWATNSNYQRQLEYDPILSSVSAWVSGQKVEKVYKTSDYTWDEGIRYWLDGDKEMAMVVLGHNLHLIQDLAVPDHTRNDEHVEGSFYEKYTSRFTISSADENLRKKLLKKTPEKFESLKDYFQRLAEYANKNFYSEDTIGIQSGYNLPIVDLTSLDVIGGKNYLVSKDDQGNKFFLVKINTLNFSLATLVGNYTTNDDSVRQSYWDLLSTKSVQYGAGVIDLFFRDAARAETDPAFIRQHSPTFWEKVSNVYESTKSFFTGIGNFIVAKTGKLFSAASVVDNFQKVDEVKTTDTSLDLPKENTIKKSSSADDTTTLKKEIANLKKEVAALKKVNSKKQNNATQVEVNDIEAELALSDKSKEVDLDLSLNCNYDNSGSPKRTILISEVAWMGSSDSASDEWIELKNVSGKEIDVTGWKLLDKGGDIAISLSNLKSKKVVPNQFLLFERTDNNSAPGKGDLIYKGTLSNSNEGLRLFDSNCALIDEALAESKWPAGDNESKKTMERNFSDFGWHTSSVSGGTPKKENSAGSMLAGVGGDSLNQASGSNSNQNTNQSANSSNNNSAATGLDYINYPEILITEVQLASSSSTKDEFVEIYNPTNKDISLTGWYIQKKTKSATSFSTFAPTSLFEGRSIRSKGFLVIAHPSTTLSYDVGTDYGLADNNLVVLKNPQGEISDSVGWGETSSCGIDCALNPPDNQSIERKSQNQIFQNTDINKNDFQISVCPNPGEFAESCDIQNSTSTPMLNIEAPSNFRLEYSSSTKKIIFSWDSASSTIPIIYKINEISSSTMGQLSEIVVNLGTSTDVTISEFGRNYKFALKACGGGQCSNSVAAEIFIEMEVSPLILSQANSNVLTPYYKAIGFIAELGSNLNGKITKLESYVEGAVVGKWEAGICPNLGDYIVRHQCRFNYSVSAFSNEEITATNTKTLLTFDFPEFTFNSGTSYGLFISPPLHSEGAVYGSPSVDPMYSKTIMYGYNANNFGYAVYNPGIDQMYFVLK